MISIQGGFITTKNSLFAKIIGWINIFLAFLSLVAFVFFIWILIGAKDLPHPEKTKIIIISGILALLPIALFLINGFLLIQNKHDNETINNQVTK